MIGGNVLKRATNRRATKDARGTVQVYLSLRNGDGSRPKGNIIRSFSLRNTKVSEAYEVLLKVVK